MGTINKFSWFSQRKICVTVTMSHAGVIRCPDMVLPSNYNSLSNETRWNKQNSDGWELYRKSCERIYLSIVKQYKSLKTYAGMASPFLEEKWGLQPRFSFSTKIKILNETLRILDTFWWPTSVCCQQNILAISIIKKAALPWLLK